MFCFIWLNFLSINTSFQSAELGNTFRWQSFTGKFFVVLGCKHFTGIKCFDVHAKVQIQIPPCACAQWVHENCWMKSMQRALSISLWCYSYLSLSLSFLCWEDMINTHRTPTLHEVLPTIHERSNPYDQYAIDAKKSLLGFVVKSTVSHLPKKSRFTRFIMVYGARVIIVDCHFCREA